MKRVSGFAAKLNRILNIIFLLAGIAFVAGEVVCRIFFEEVLRTRAFPLIYQADEAIGYRYIPGTTSEICVPSICKPVVINGNGFPGPAVPQEKPEGVYRIAIIESSEGTGIWMDGTESYAEVLQQLCRNDGYNVEVVNLSIDGKFRDSSKMHLLLNDAVRYQADLAFITLTLPMRKMLFRRENYKGYVISYANVPGAREMGMRQVDELEEATIFTTVYDISYMVRALYRFVRHYIQGYQGTNIHPYVTKRIDVGIANLRSSTVTQSAEEIRSAFASLKQRHGMDVLLLQYRENPQYRNVAQVNGLPFLSLNIPFDPSLVHEHDGHFNQRGHRIIAERIYEGLLSGTYFNSEEHLLPELQATTAASTPGK